jgi:hypothetical protein
VLDDLPVIDYIDVFYPTFEHRIAHGYTYDIVEIGSMWNSIVWQPSSFKNTFPGAAERRPSIIASEIRVIENNMTKGDKLPHESWVIVNSQDISLYKSDFNMKATFFIQNKYVEYQADGSTPVDLLVKVSTDYDGKVGDATWTQVNDNLVCAIANAPDVTFTGTPYPGDQKGDDPEGKKDLGKNADGKWVKCELDLTDYKESNNFTLGFHVKSFYV